MKKVVAINYIDGTYAPRVLAKGTGCIAESILAQAEKFEVPIVKNNDLIQVLFDTDLFDYIPEEVFDITATILAFVYENERNI